jgi:hypothetical protein
MKVLTVESGKGVAKCRVEVIVVMRRIEVLAMESESEGEIAA